jgi:mannose-6-phosphate isomerase
VERIWGRRTLPLGFGGEEQGGQPIGEIWFEDPRGRDGELLVKFLFTSESLSIQVHPDNAAAARSGHKSGKDEAWWVLAAEEGAKIGLGLVEPTTKERLKEAAGDGRIIDMLEWIPAAEGQFHYLKAGTIHALGAGLSLVEIQQNVDLTYRLFDYGRGRELQLDLAVEAADLAPGREQPSAEALAPGRDILACGGEFVVEMWSGPRSLGASAVAGKPIWLVPISGSGTIDAERLGKGTVWLVEEKARLDLEADARLLVAYPGGEPRAEALSDEQEG